MILSNQQFLIELTNLFHSRQLKGSVFLTTKRYTYEEPPTTTTTTGEGEDSIMKEVESRSTSGSGIASGSGSSRVQEEKKEFPCLIRASDGQDKKAKIKISTLVQPNDYETFSIQYGTILKTILSTGLKQKKKVKAALIKKKKEGNSSSVNSKVTAATGGGVGARFKVRLPKIIGPMRGAGVKKRKRCIQRREKVLNKMKKRGKVLI